MPQLNAQCKAKRLLGGILNSGEGLTESVEQIPVDTFSVTSGVQALPGHSLDQVINWLYFVLKRG